MKYVKPNFMKILYQCFPQVMKIKEGCVYVTALNKQNAMKKYQKNK